MKYKKVTRPVKHKFVMTSEELYTLMSLITKYGDLKRSTLPDSDRDYTDDEHKLISIFNRAYHGRGF